MIISELLSVIWIDVNILAQRARLWVTPGRGCFPESQTS